MPINSITEYENACVAQLAEDEVVGIHSLYLPNTFFSDRPSPMYCLIASEPSLSALGEFAFNALIEQGMTNFMYSRGDFMLQYCAYRFLCDDRFEYAMTDLSKGAMAVNHANLNRNQRYDRWLPILRDELEFYGDPLRIAVGRIPENYMLRQGLASNYVRHYSGNNYGDFTAFWTERPQDHYLANDLEAELREFMASLFRHVAYPDALSEAAFNRVFAIDPLPVAIRGMFLEFRQTFTDIREANS